MTLRVRYLRYIYESVIKSGSKGHSPTSNTISQSTCEYTESSSGRVDTPDRMMCLEIVSRVKFISLFQQQQQTSEACFLYTLSELDWGFFPIPAAKKKKIFNYTSQVLIVTRTLFIRRGSDKKSRPWRFLSAVHQEIPFYSLYANSHHVRQTSRRKAPPRLIDSAIYSISSAKVLLHSHCNRVKSGVSVFSISDQSVLLLLVTSEPLGDLLQVLVQRSIETPRLLWQTVRSSAVRGQACHACVHTCPGTGANFISYLWKRKSLSKPRAFRFVWTTAGKKEMKSEFRLMHTDDAEKLMLCSVYIIKRRVYNHLLRLEKWTRERRGGTYALQWMWQV